MEMEKYSASGMCLWKPAGTHMLNFPESKYT